MNSLLEYVYNTKGDFIMSEHKESCGCGTGCDCGPECGCDHDHDVEELTVTLTLDNDEELECAVLCIYSVEEQEYIALLPIDQEEEVEGGDVLIYRYAEVDGAPTLDNIDSDDEYEKAADAFDEWLDEQEFNEIQESLDSAE